MNGKKNKNILLIGGRSKAKSMAVSLIEQGYHVTAIFGLAADTRLLGKTARL